MRKNRIGKSITTSMIPHSPGLLASHHNAAVSPIMVSTIPMVHGVTTVSHLG